MAKIDPRVKDVLKLLGAGVFLAGCYVFPTLPMAVAPIVREIERKEREERLKKWEKFNPWRLRQIVKRLREQKMVEIVEKDGETVVVLTEKGKVKYLNYNLGDMMVDKPPKWDGEWRLVIYDISKYKRKTQDIFRETLKKFRFLRLQKSVYLYPFPCHNEIEFLRQYYGIEDDVILLTVSGLENEEAFKRYFGI